MNDQGNQGNQENQENQGGRGGPSDTDDEDEDVDEVEYNTVIDNFIESEPFVNFAAIDRSKLYQIIKIGSKLIKNMRCVLNRSERGIMNIWYHVILYYIYSKSSQEHKSTNARNFLVLLTSRHTITGKQSIEKKFILCAIWSDRIDLFRIILSYISRNHEVDFYTEILSIYFVKNSNKLHLLEEFWRYMNLDTKYGNLINPKTAIMNKIAIVNVMGLRFIAEPNIKQFLLCKFALLKKKYIQEKEKYISKKRPFANDANDADDANDANDANDADDTSNSKIAKFE
jgi:hypothetical protein